MSGQGLLNLSPPSFPALMSLRFLCQTIYNAMLNGTPCVVFESSGRIADVIAHVAGLPVSRVTIGDIKKLMKRFFGQEYDAFSDTSIVDWTKKVCVLYQKRPTSYVVC